MSNTIVTYSYAGGNTSELCESCICLESTCWVTYYFDVVIYYGAYLGASSIPNGPVPPSVTLQPRNLPPLQNVKFNARINRVNGGAFLTPTLIFRQDIMEPNNPANCMGTKFVFASPLLLQDCTNQYNMNWSTEEVSMAYGADEITIAPQSGVISNFEYCC